MVYNEIKHETLEAKSGKNIKRTERRIEIKILVRPVPIVHAL